MTNTTVFEGGSVRLYTSSPGLVWRAESFLTKETDTLAWIDGFERGCTFWDIGANVGVYSLYAAVARAASVLAFEPAAANFYALNRNVHLNGQANLISTYCLAFAAMTRIGTLNLSSIEMGTACNQFGDLGQLSPYSEANSPCIAQGVLGFSIDSFIENFDPPFPSYLKIDVDGLELDILSGARNFLADLRLESILIELSVTTSHDTDATIGILEGAGFELRSLGAVQGAGTQRGANHIFRRPSV
jgi:FkbM family methyltransferase